MNVLIVEDLKEKAVQVDAVLRSVIASTDLSLDRAESVIGAIRKLESGTYDLLILDLVLPIRDGEAAAETGGKQILSEIIDGTTCKRPSHIICLTAFEDISGVLRDEAEKTLVHIVIYKDSDPKWKTTLEAKAQYVQRRLKDSEVQARAHNLDIAIVTSSPLVELKEITKLPPGFVAEYNQNDSLYYYFSRWKTNGRMNLTIVACAAPSMGMTAACATA